MKSNKALIQSLRKLSPLFNRLVDKALEQGITIITFDEYAKVASEYWQVSGSGQRVVFNTANFPEIGIKKAITIDIETVLDWTNGGDLGRCEIDFAHEIGHNLSWDDKPGCAMDFSASIPSYFGCAYFEALAYKLGFEILKDVGRGRELFLFRGSHEKPLRILHHYGLPDQYIINCLRCPALKVYELPSCPKMEETGKLVREIGQFDKE